MHWKPPTLESDRLVLRPVSEDDAEAVFAACSNPTLTRYTLFETHRTVTDSLRFVWDYALANYLEMVPDPFGITLKGDPESHVVGCVGCHWASRPNHTLELGYWLAEPYWGQGLTAEAAAVVVRYCFANYPAERIQARVIVGNEASVRVLEKIGFMYEGTMRKCLSRRGEQEDVMVFAKLRSETVE
jgi:ribosomal-protein-alanine N-acetyltransferase